MLDYFRPSVSMISLGFRTFLLPPSRDEQLTSFHNVVLSLSANIQVLIDLEQNCIIQTMFEIDDQRTAIVEFPPDNALFCAKGTAFVVFYLIEPKLLLNEKAATLHAQAYNVYLPHPCFLKSFIFVVATVLPMIRRPPIAVTSPPSFSSM